MTTDDRGLDALRPPIEAVITRWYHLGMIRFSSRDDGGDDLILRDELAAAILGERGVFLPEGLPVSEGERAAREFVESITRDCGHEAEIERLRGLLDEAVNQLSAEPNGWHYCRWCSGMDRHEDNCAWVARNQRIAAIRDEARAALRPEPAPEQEAEHE